VKENRDYSVRSQRSFARAIVKAVGDDPAAVERALREDLEVHIPDEEGAFVFHVACDACLASDQSPTAEKNRGYEAATLQVDRNLHRLWIEMAKIETERHRIFDEAGVPSGRCSGELMLQSP
jgi:hypothetical protein